MKGSTTACIGKLLEGEAQSPIGPLVASALAKGRAKSRAGTPTPYLGYYYQILTRQGKNAPGGARDYIVNGKMTEGFAFLAYPAEYMIVRRHDIHRQPEWYCVCRKISALRLMSLTKIMKGYNPDSSWKKAEEPQEETAGDQRNPIGGISSICPSAHQFG